MDFSRITQRLLPTLVALLLFFGVSALYFAPQFQGEVLPQHDVVQYEGMAKDIKQLRSQTGEDAQWTGGMFSGMPAYLISVLYPAQLVKNSIGQVVKVIDTPAGFLFFAMTSFWLMLLLCGVNPWVSIVGALAYGLSTYFLLIIGAGHITKMWALVYAPLMMGGAWLTLRGNCWVGAVITAVATSLEIGANHPQITYYFLLAMAAFWLSEGIFSWREGRLKAFFKRTALLSLAGLLAVGSNFAPLWYTAQHTPDTMRGGSELATAEETASGLELEYATAWSYGKLESFNLLIPDFMGRDSGQSFPADGVVASTAREFGLSGIEQQLPAYWGEQPYTAGPTYLGAAAIFLAALALLLLAGRDKWWAVAISLLMLLLAWGRHLMGFTEWAFDFLPGYNKFRTVSMTLVVVQWVVPLLGALLLGKLWKAEISRERLLQGIAWAGGVVGGICLLFAVAGSSLFSFGQEQSTVEMTAQFNRLLQASQMQNLIDSGFDVELGEAIGAAMAEDRATMMADDAWRSLLMVLLAAGILLLFAFGKIKRILMVGGLVGVMLLDLIPVDRRFLSDENFISARRQQVVATSADKAIMQDKELGYRVLNLMVSPFNDATPSYFHRSVGGYHGAKLARYQDLIDRYLVEQDEQVLDMLNTRYLIIPNEAGEPTPLRRESAFGAAWFVDQIRYASTPQEEISLLGSVDLRTTAVVAEKDRLATPPTNGGQERAVALVEYRPNYLRYTCSAEEASVVVFSEIFYEKGWKAYIDGVESPAFRADYLLRAMEVPAGDHTIEWRFRAPNWGVVEGITGLCSAVILLGALALLVGWIIERKKAKK